MDYFTIDINPRRYSGHPYSQHSILLLEQIFREVCLCEFLLLCYCMEGILMSGCVLQVV